MLLDGSSYTIPTDVTSSYSETEPHSSWVLVKENGEIFDIWTIESASDISIGSKWVTFNGINCYLPICLATHNADGTAKSGWKSIDQVLNGFGYIGSTVFVLPGVKYEYANGLNSDGAYVNGFGETTSVLTTTYTYTTSTTQSLFITNNNDIWRCGQFFVVENPPTSGPAYRCWYVQSLNCFYSTYDGTTVPKSHKGMPFIQIASNIETNSSFKVTNIDFEGVDGLLTSNANNLSPIGRSYLSGLGMPSDTGYLVSNSFSSSTNFVAPANGYFRFRAMSVAAGGQLVFLMNQSSRLMVGGSFHKSAAGQGSNIILPAKKGQTIQVQYNNSNLTADQSCGLWFIPCEGKN